MSLPITREARKEIRAAIEKLDTGGLGAVESTIEVLKKYAEKDQYVGKKDMTPDEVVIWYVGQGISLLSDPGAFFAVNSWLNCAYKFCPLQDS